jgi:hypothetical protein
MRRHLGWALTLVAGILLGGALNSWQATGVSPAVATAVEPEQSDADVVKELREVKAEVKEINAFLRSGTLRVVNVLYPDQKP